MRQSDILITATPSPTRRWTAVAMLAMLAVILFSLALAEPTPPLWRIGFAGMGIFSFWSATAIWAATREGLELTRSELRTEGGEVIASVADVVAVDRGAFAFKPSHGFLLKTRSPGPRRWVPGLWWRTGRRIGVGGVMPGGQTRAMAELMTALVQGILPPDEERPD